MVDPLLQNAVVSTRKFTLPCGTLLLGAVEGKLAFCDWESGWHRATVQKRLDRFLKPAPTRSSTVRKRSFGNTGKGSAARSTFRFSFSALIFRRMSGTRFSTFPGAER